MTQWHPQAYSYVQQKDYVRAADTYEQEISNEPGVITHYFYLGLIQLLQGLETDAQFTWMANVTEDTSAEEIDGWTSDLVEILYQESLRQCSNSDYETALLICQHIYEINKSNLNNLLTLAWLSIQLQILKAEDVAFIDLVECLLAAGTSQQQPILNHALLWEVLAGLLDYHPTYPLLIEFTEACLTFVNETNVFIHNLINASLNLAYRFERNALAINLLKLCLCFPIKQLEVSEQLCRLHLRNGDLVNAIDTARLYRQLSESLEDKIFSNVLLLSALLDKGTNWEEVNSIFASQKSLLSLIIAKNPAEMPQAIINRLFITCYFTPFIEDQPSLNRPMQNQIAQLCQASSKVNLFAQMQKFGQRDRSNSQKLKIGYISRCMATHSVGWLARWLIKYHDRNQFQLYGYFHEYSQHIDDLQAWYANQMDQVYRVGIDGINDCYTVADKIYQDQIDILVDLDSITFDTTCAVMALKPAPVQLTWLGSDASGIPTVDYFIADPYVLPDHAQDYYSERIWRLPQTYIAVDGFEIGIPNLCRNQLGIPLDAVVYLSAQRGYKRHPETISLQMQIVKAVPDSYFLIKGSGDQESLKDLFIQTAIKENVDPDRLRFLPLTESEAIHRANLSIADIVLDTYPYNGATTTLETLWMCIPIVTRVGEQFAARNSYTMMINAGIIEGIARSDQEYVEWGIKLGMNETLRQQIYWKLKSARKTAPLWNSRQFTKEMEQAYIQMWEIYQT